MRTIKPMEPPKFSLGFSAEFYLAMKANGLTLSFDEFKVSLSKYNKRRHIALNRFKETK